MDYFNEDYFHIGVKILRRFQLCQAVVQEAHIITHWHEELNISVYISL